MFQFPLFFGTAFFTFEGISCVLPLQNRMEKPEEINSAINKALTMAVFCYISLGVLGYLKYGDQVLGSITLNLPNTW